MASKIKPRSVKDATRFTSTVPHASSRLASPAQNVRPNTRVETPEQRVMRLRKAHLAAQKAKVPLLDRIIVGSRPYLDMAHRGTVTILVLFTVICSIVSAYSVWDMIQFNRARRTEWIEAQKQLEADALSAARVAYLKGEATEEQVLLVEEATREAEERGAKLPPLLSQPERRTHFEEHVKPVFEEIGETEKENKDGKGIFGVISSLVGAGKDRGEKESPQETATSLTTTTLTTDQASTTQEATSVLHMIKEKAAEAWELEKENQRNGGSLDRLGLEKPQTPPSEARKRSWWPW